MIYKGKIAIKGVYVGTKIVTAVYRGGVMIWELINSCFGSGSWKGEKNWNGNDLWK